MIGYIISWSVFVLLLWGSIYGYILDKKNVKGEVNMKFTEIVKDVDMATKFIEMNKIKNYNIIVVWEEWKYIQTTIKSILAIGWSYVKVPRMCLFM